MWNKLYYIAVNYYSLYTNNTISLTKSRAAQKTGTTLGANLQAQ